MFAFSRSNDSLVDDSFTGTFNDLLGQSSLASCVPCRAGYISTSGSSVCTACPIGTFSKSSGSVSCQPCPPGFFSDLPGQGSCLPCPQQTYSDVSGASVCKRCPDGLYALFNALGSPVCERCYENALADAEGTCRCVPGSWRAGPELCAPCADGYFQPDSDRLQCIAVSLFCVVI